MKYIKYKRFETSCKTAEDIQEFLDDLITDGYEIINYFEKRGTYDTKNFFYDLIVIAGKLRNDREVL